MNLITRNEVKYEEITYYSQITKSYFAWVRGTIVKITELEFKEIVKNESLVQIPFDRRNTKPNYILYGLQITNQ